jgi:hypothetical protein
MLLLDKTKSHVNLYLVITLVDTRRLWKLSKSLLLSCLQQFDYVLLRCVLIFWSPPCWFLTLWLSLFAIPLLHNACSYNLIGATRSFTLVVCSVMVPRLAIYGAAMEPRASLWAADAWLCCWVRAGIKVSSHDPLPNCTDVLFSCELFLGYLSISYRRYIYQTESSRASFWSHKRITFVELVTDININRLQEVVDKWLHLVVPVMVSVI